MDLWSDQLDRLAAGSQLTAGGRPLGVTSSRPHQGRHLVRFAGIADREAAEALRDLVLEAEARTRPGTLWVHDLVGATVRTVEGRPLGSVVAVEANPASDLLVLDDATLIPLTFVVEHEPGTRITVELPPGLLDED